MNSGRFERHSKKLFATYLGILGATFLVLAEFSLRSLMGLGNPVIYDSNPLYGYRPLPHQDVVRFHGARLRFNNLGLRAEGDWDPNPKKKVLFLGDSVTYGGSYIGNSELFSTLAVRGIPGYSSGNAGVNGWGVENIYGLVVESEFLPAETYVTVLPEGDFYRGITRLLGTPFWCKKPILAVQELVYYGLMVLNNWRYVHWKEFADGTLRSRVVEKAVSRLSRMDAFIKSHGHSHLIFIAPTRAQVIDGAAPDSLLAAHLAQHKLRVIYLRDSLAEVAQPREAKVLWFHDDIHLEKRGHAIYARIISGYLRQDISGFKAKADNIYKE